MIKEKVYAHIKTEKIKKHVESLFHELEFINKDEIAEKEKSIIIYEIISCCSTDEVKNFLETNNFFLFISDECHDDILHELSKENFFDFCLHSDPLNEIKIRFNTLVKHKDLFIELETKNEEMESTIFELAFASTNVLEQNEFLEQMAKKDGLTMLYNHSFFKDKLKEEILRSKRYNNSFTIALFDLDFFKRVNDEYGHVKGDEVIKVFAGIIKETIRNTDIAARYGGEEFAVLFTETTLDDAFQVVERIREKFENTVFESNKECFKVTFSAGVTSYDKSFKDAEFMVDIADKALYTSKSNGRNRTTILTADNLQL